MLQRNYFTNVLRGVNNVVCSIFRISPPVKSSKIVFLDVKFLEFKVLFHAIPGLRSINCASHWKVGNFWVYKTPGFSCAGLKDFQISNPDILCTENWSLVHFAHAVP